MIQRKNKWLMAAVWMLATVTLDAATKVPRPLADVTIDTMDARRIRLLDLKGKVRVIAVISTACEHCATIMPTLNKLDQAFRNRGVVIVGADADDNPRLALPPFLAKHKPTFQMGMLSQNNTQRLGDFTTADRPFIPILIVVDKKDQVVFQFFGKDPIYGSLESGLRAILENLLKAK